MTQDRIDINTVLKEGLSTELLLKYIEASPTVKAAIAEAVHRFYYDLSFSPYSERPFDTPEFEIISAIHQTTHCLNPDWRTTLNKAAERYSYKLEPTTALYIGAKPTKLITVTPSINLNYLQQ